MTREPSLVEELNEWRITPTGAEYLRTHDDRSGHVSDDVYCDDDLARSQVESRGIVVDFTVLPPGESKDKSPKLDCPLDKLGSPPTQRIKFDKQTLSITLDEKTHVLDAKSYSAVEWLYSRIGKVTNSTEIRIHVRGLKGNNAVTDLFAKLPKPIKACIKSKRGSGYEFSLPPIKKNR